MSLAQLIQQYAQDLAVTNDWIGVAAVMSAKTIKVSLGKVGGKASLEALVAAGEDPNKVIGAMQAVPMSNVLLNTLIASGVDWDDPMTGLIMGGLVDAGLINATVVTAMRALSVRMDSPAGGDVTAAECEAAVEAAKLESDWTAAQNTNINAAVYDRVALVAALRLSADELEAG